MKAVLQLRQSQQLTLTQQLQQAIRLLQLSTLEINQESARLLDENPFLEREEDATPVYAQGDAQSPGSASSSGEGDNPERDGAPADAEWAEPGLSGAGSGSNDDEDEGHAEIAAERRNAPEGATA